MFVFDHPSFDAHESVHAVHDAATGLRAIIAVHSSALGPGCGGCRIWHYDSDEDALADALRLSHAMSYKSAMAGLDLGGGKCVVLKPKGEFDREAMFKALGCKINALGGLYVGAADVGIEPQDLINAKSETEFMAGLPKSEGGSGDSSPVTADGVFRGLKAAALHRLGSDDVRGLTIAVQGVGHVGMALCQHLHDAGANLVVTDINAKGVSAAKDCFGARAVGLDEIYDQAVDIFAPCALGGAINPNTLPRLTARIIAGAANNQLSSPDMGDALAAQNILYAPDYVINAGGIINIASEVNGNHSADWVEAKLAALPKTLTDIFEQAEKTGIATNVAADAMARARIGRG